MRNRKHSFNIKNLVIPVTFWLGISFNASGHGDADHTGSTTSVVPGLPDCQILAAARIFDGINFPQENMAVLIEGDKIKQVGALGELSGLCVNQINLGDGNHSARIY